MVDVAPPVSSSNATVTITHGWVAMMSLISRLDRIPRLQPKYVLYASLLIAAVFWAIVALGSHDIAVKTVLLKSGVDPLPGRTITLPYVAEEDPQYKLATYEINFTYSPGQQAIWRIYPDDCIRRIAVNGININLTPYKKQLCAYADGMQIDILPYIKDGGNTVNIDVENLGGGYGLKINTWQSGTLLSDPFAIFIAFTAMCVFYLFLCRRPEILAISCVALAVLLVLFLQRVNAIVYDWDRHMETIMYYVQHFSIPSPLTGGEAYQAPLYYFLAAIIYKATSYFSDTGYQWEVLRAFNFFLFSMFLLYGVLSILLIIKPRFLAFIGVATLLFWPANILHSGRISNDILLNLSFIACIYHSMRCYRRYDATHLKYALLWLAVAFATKSSSLVLFTALTLNVMVRYGDRRHLHMVRDWLRQPLLMARIKPFAMVSLALCVGVLLGYGRNLYNYFHLENASLVIGSIPDEAESHANFIPSEFLYFDYWAYISRPYITWSLASKNELFWNFYLRTMSFGVFLWNGITQAQIINFMLLAIWVYLAILIFHRYMIQRRPLGWAGCFAIFIGCIIYAHAYFKARYYGCPFADVRHMFTVIPLLLLAYLHMLNLYKRINKRIYGLGLAFLVIYLCASLAHYALQIIPA